MFLISSATQCLCFSSDIVFFHCLKLSVCIPNRIHSDLHVPLHLLQESDANGSRCTPPQGHSLSNALCLCLCLSLYVLCISLSLLISIIWSVLSISQFLCVLVPIFFLSFMLRQLFGFAVYWFILFGQFNFINQSYQCVK
jgi:hypothetical protein